MSFPPPFTPATPSLSTSSYSSRGPPPPPPRISISHNNNSATPFLFPLASPASSVDSNHPTTPMNGGNSNLNTPQQRSLFSAPAVQSKSMTTPPPFNPGLTSPGAPIAPKAPQPSLPQNLTFAPAATPHNSSSSSVYSPPQVPPCPSTPRSSGAVPPLSASPSNLSVVVLQHETVEEPDLISPQRPSAIRSGSVSQMAHMLKIPMGVPRQSNPSPSSVQTVYKTPTQAANLSALPEVPPTPQANNSGSFSITKMAFAPSDAPAASPPQSPSNTKVFTEADLDTAVDTLQAFQFQFDLSVQQFKLEKDVTSLQLILVKIDEWMKGGQFTWLLEQTFSAREQATARGFQKAFEKEKQNFLSYLAQHGEVLNSLLKMFNCSPLHKLDKDALKKVLEESRQFHEYGNTGVQMSLIQTAEGILSNVELQDGLLQQVAEATRLKDAERLENLLARAHAAGIDGEKYPEIAEAERCLQKTLAQQNKSKKTTPVAQEKSSFTDLQSVLQDSSTFVTMGSVLPLSINYKTLGPATSYNHKTNTVVLDEHLLGIDTSIEGIRNLPNLHIYLDKYIRLPIIMYDCLQYLRYHFAASEEGIFRLSGNNDNIANALLKYRHQHEQCIKNGGYIQSIQGFLRPIYTGPLTEQHPSLLIQFLTSPHDATNTMKRWLRSLDEPIVPFATYQQWLGLPSIPHLPFTFNSPIITDVEVMNDHYKQSQRLQTLHKYIHELPPENIGILQYLALYLYVFSLSHLKSKMTPENLSIVVAPNLLRSQQESQENGAASPSTPGGQDPLLALLSMKKQGNDMMANSKAVNEVITLVIKYAPILLVPPE